MGGKSIRSIQQLASFNKNDRNKVMKNFTPEEQTDILQVLCALPKITMNVKPEGEWGICVVLRYGVHYAIVPASVFDGLKDVWVPDYEKVINSKFKCAKLSNHYNRYHYEWQVCV